MILTWVLDQKEKKFQKYYYNKFEYELYGKQYHWNTVVFLGPDNSIMVIQEKYPCSWVECGKI